MTDLLAPVDPADDPADDPSGGAGPEPASEGSGSAGPIAAGLVLMLVLTIGFGVLFWTIAKPPSPQHLSFTIPAGTDVKITTLVPVDVIPAEIRLRKGGSITLINEDRVSFQFGTLSVGAGQTVTKTFPETGSFRNTCRLTPGQEVLITVY